MPQYRVTFTQVRSDVISLEDLKEQFPLEYAAYIEGAPLSGMDFVEEVFEEVGYDNIFDYDSFDFVESYYDIEELED